ncbi:hypothetical protein [Streptomyces sp. S063]|uniref:hypothetical protein n=1 Tax=Streptomyces sp. S063 TaxID=2005885 RepID=UPI001F36A51B|nr:hypothetical protein [Streptomyces sp. S063]
MNWGYARSWAASLEWGDWPAWLACLFAAIALWISIRAQKDGRRSANASETSATAAQASVTAAQASVEEARLSRLASERSATVAEETLADQRREAAERRAAEEEANRPRPRFLIEIIGRNQYRLRNVGTGPATGITVAARDEPYIMGRIHDVALVPREAFPFTMVGAAGAPIPGTLYVTWDGQTEEVAVAVPG